LLWGRKDRLIDVGVAIWSKGLANLRVEVWEGIGHMPMVEAPAGSARLYREFLASLRSESLRINACTGDVVLAE
jgi:pimeloyl-ACP methyl ester carboxylesterase